MTTTTLTPADCTLRYARTGDREAIVRLAELDSQREPTGTLLVAESEAGIVAVLPLGGDDAIADPFVRTAEVVEALRLRAAQLSSEPSAQRTGLRHRAESPGTSVCGDRNRNRQTPMNGVKTLMERVRSKPIYALLAAAVPGMIALLLSPALARAEWTAPADLSAAGQDASNPRVAVDADGGAVFTWRRSDGTNVRVQARARSAAGVLSPIQTLSKSGQNATQPRVAVDATGDAVFTWLRSDGTDVRVQARARSAAGALSPVQTLSGSGQNASSPQVAVDATGDAVFAWRRSDGTNIRAQARARSAAGALSAVQTLSGAGQEANEPQVAVDATGDAVFAWQRSDGANFRVQARARSAAGALSPVQDLSDAGQNAFEPQVAVDDAGDAVFAWGRSDGTNIRAQARARSAAGALSPVQTLSDAGRSAFSPRVAVDRTGDAVFAWYRSDGTNSRVQARARSAAGALSPVQTLSQNGRDASNPKVAVDATGDAVFAWDRSDGTNVRVQARARAAAGTLSGVQTVSGAGQDAFAGQVAVDSDGDAALTWQRSDGTNIRVQASAGP